MPIRIKDKSTGVISSGLPSEGNQIVVYDGTSGASVKPAPIVITDLAEFQSVGNQDVDLFVDTDTQSLDIGHTAIAVTLNGDSLVLTGTTSIQLDSTSIDVGQATGTTVVRGSTTTIASDSQAGSTTTVNGKTINIGEADSTVNFNGTVNNNNVTNLNVTDKLITINDGGGAGSGNGSGLEVEENATITGYLKTKSDRNGWDMKAPNQTGVATIEIDSDNFTVDKTIVKGPTSGTDNKLIKSDGTNGRLIQESGITIDDSDNMSGIGTINSGGIQSSGDVDAVNVSVSGKLETAETANRALETNASGEVSASAVTSTELGYVSGVTSSIQGQLDGKQTNTLTDGNILIGNSSNEATSVDPSSAGDIEADETNGLTIKAGAVDTDELATDAVEEAKIANGAVTDDKVASGIDAAKIADGSVSNTEYQYLDGVTSGIQGQIDSKMDKITSTDEAIARYDGTSGDVQDSGVTINDSDEVSGITQLNVDNIRLDGNSVSSTDTNGNLNLSPNGTGRVISSNETELQGAVSVAKTDDNSTTGANQTLSLPSTEIVRLGNAGLTSIDGITAPTRSQKVTLINATGNSITISNDLGATAANRILTGLKTDLTIEDEASINLVYDLTESRWMVVGGTGSGIGRRWN